MTCNERVSRRLIEMFDASTTLLGSLVGHLPCRTRPAACLVGWVTMLVVTREGDRCCKLRLSQRAMAALEYLRAQHPGEDRCRVRNQRVPHSAQDTGQQGADDSERTVRGDARACGSAVEDHR